MTQSFDELFDKVISLWPEKLPVSEKTLHKNGGANIPALTAAHETIEKKILGMDENDMLLQVDWAVYTVLHQMARSLIIIEPEKVDREIVRGVFERNLEAN